jgi:GntR family transcriptional regulator
MPTSHPVISIDIASPTPAYRQVADALRALLVSGRLKAGDPLPTGRELATDLGVHHNTVAESYRLLAEEGWLDLKRRRGVTVLARTAPPPSANADRSFRRRLEELAAEARAQGLSAADVAQALRTVASAQKG